MARRITIRTNILSNILLVVLIVSLALISLQYYASRSLVRDSTAERFRLLGDKARETLQGWDGVISQSLEILSAERRLERFPSQRDPHEIVRMLSAPMRQQRSFYAVYLGYRDGRLLEVVNLMSQRGLKSFYHTSPRARWLLIRVYPASEGWVRRFDAYRADYTLLGSRQEPSAYRATARPWYRQALGRRGIVRTDPYLFANLREKGVTYSLETERQGVVLALDTTLTKLNALLKRLKFAPRSHVVLLDGKREMVAASDRDGVGRELEIYRELIRRGAQKEVVKYERNGETFFAMVIPLRLGGKETWLGLSVDEETMVAPYLELLRRELILAAFLLLLMLPLVHVTTRRIVRPIRALMAENEKVRQRRFDAVRRIETAIIEFDQLSRSLVEMSESLREYQEAQKNLLDAFIRLIADAIDAKSPYTGGHCQRVPVIAQWLLKEADRCEEGALAGFRMEGAEAWEAFERAAWLHDCGKITTPEYVVDKATRLETIYNRIHEIRTRFEVLWRDLQIAYYEGLLRGEDRRRLEMKLHREQARLLDEFDFIARVNVGEELLDEAGRERIRRIARRTWLRHFDDRIGLSEIERRRTPVRALPAEERLLADRPEHRIPREGFDEDAYRQAGFTMPVPELLYNRGELHNLCIRQGTLTPEERFKINEHVIQTLRMLERLPFPETMKRIPEYAGTHHEHLDGSGYPRSLKAPQLSLPSRVMAIADIFEALTASDRPYKKGKKLSVTLKIMVEMACENHIDPELLRLFIRSGIYRKYARDYLKPEQVDVVEEKELLSMLQKAIGE